MPFLIASTVFAAVALLAYMLLAVFFSEERRVTRALRTVSEWEGSQAAAAEPLLKPFGTRILSPIAGTLASALRSTLPANARVNMQHRIELAGSPRGVTPEGIVGARIVCALAAPLLVVPLWLVAESDLGTLIWLLALLALIAGWFAPDVYLGELRRRRQHAIRRALPDMLDMLTISVQAGLGFDMALSKLVRNTSGPLAEEFGRMLNEVQSGMSRRDGFRRLGERTDVAELNNFIMAMVQADVFGVSVSGILRTQAVEMRRRRRQLAQELAQKTPVKMVFPIIFCMLPATMLVVVGPAVIAIGRAFGLIE